MSQVRVFNACRWFKYVKFEFTSMMLMFMLLFLTFKNRLFSTVFELNPTQLVVGLRVVRSKELLPAG